MNSSLKGQGVFSKTKFVEKYYLDAIGWLVKATLNARVSFVAYATAKITQGKLMGKNPFKSVGTSMEVDYSIKITIKLRKSNNEIESHPLRHITFSPDDLAPCFKISH